MTLNEAVDIRINSNNKWKTTIQPAAKQKFDD